jgi:lipoyl(octanoyl) transferase
MSVDRDLGWWVSDGRRTDRALEQSGGLEVVDLGRVAYAPAYEAQQAHHAEVLGWREAVAAGAARPLGRVLIVEHDPVITISRRPGVADHLLASPELLAARGIEVCETDRGGDITYHGPGQVVLYPIVDLKRAGIRVVEYVRLLERAVIETIAGYGVAGERDDEATGVWVPPTGEEGQAAKVCAIGVRVRKWVTLHGLALNVRTDLSHFETIVPCGLAGRPVTSLEKLLGDRCPAFGEVAARVAARIGGLLDEVE